MSFDPERHHRHSIRLKGYDYSQQGRISSPFTEDRVCLFCEAMGGEMRLNDAGRMVRDVWSNLPVFYSGVPTGAFTVKIGS